MAGERVQRQIERPIDVAEEASAGVVRGVFQGAGAKVGEKVSTLVSCTCSLPSTFITKITDSRPRPAEKPIIACVALFERVGDKGGTEQAEG